MFIPRTQHYAARLGEAEFVARMAAEQGMRECRGARQGEGLFRLENKIDLYGLIKFCLKLSGFWNRAVRNYFDIQVVNNEVRLKNLPPEFDGYTILQLSDLHADLHPDFPRIKKLLPLWLRLPRFDGGFLSTFGEHTGATEATMDILADVTAKVRSLITTPYKSLLWRAGIRLLNEHIYLAG